MEDGDSWGGDGGDVTAERELEKNPPSDDKDILRGLDKELIEEINNQIVNNGEEVTFDDIAGLDNIKETVHPFVIWLRAERELEKNPPSNVEIAATANDAEKERQLCAKLEEINNMIVTLEEKFNALKEQAQGVALLKTEIERERTEMETLWEELNILKAEVSLLEGKDPEESTTTNLPRRVQPSRRSKSHPMNSLGAAVDQSSKNTGRRNKTPDEKDIPEELHGLEKEFVQKINNEIVVRGQKITFDDIAGLENAKEAVHELVIFPMKRPDLYTGLRATPKGLLLFGPPGAGKATIAKAIAHKSGATFFSISSSDLTSKWLGEGEKLVKTLFAMAAYKAPSVVFIDEVDSMLTHRRAEDDAIRRMKREFLVQVDGAVNRREGRVFVIGATNRPQDLDEGARRIFAKRLYLPLPNQSARESLLRTLVAESSHSLTDDDFKNLSRDTEGYSGADLKNLCNDVSYSPMTTQSSEAWMSMSISPNDVPLIPISYEHFCRSLRITSPSVGQEDLQAYVDWSNAHGTKSAFLKFN